jgi:hypothetical protein
MFSISIHQKCSYNKSEHQKYPIHPISPLLLNKCSKFLFYLLKSFIIERDIWLCKSLKKEEKKKREKRKKKYEKNGQVSKRKKEERKMNKIVHAL